MLIDGDRAHAGEVTASDGDQFFVRWDDGVDEPGPYTRSDLYLLT